MIVLLSKMLSRAAVCRRYNLRALLQHPPSGAAVTKASCIDTDHSRTNEDSKDKRVLNGRTSAINKARLVAKFIFFVKVSADHNIDPSTFFKTDILAWYKGKSGMV